MTSKILFCGEAYGEREDKFRVPFIGTSGQELTRMLFEAEIYRYVCPRHGPQMNVSGNSATSWLCNECKEADLSAWHPYNQSQYYFTNTLNFRPPDNKIEALCVSKKEDTTDLPPISPGKYLREEYLGELSRLRLEIQSFKPNVIVALGNVACWALINTTKISKLRGNITQCHMLPEFKVLPVYHPAAILRQWEMRHVTVLDLQKAKRESAYPEIRRPKRLIHMDPDSIEELYDFKRKYLDDASEIGFDIETWQGQISRISFAPDETIGLCVPIIDFRKPGYHYWSLPDEVRAWHFIRGVFALPATNVAQNGLFDVTHLWANYGTPVPNFDEDTMLLHHSLHPESLKGLGFLGSVYTEEVAWKTLVRHKTAKKDD